MSPLQKALVLGFLTAIVGLAASVSSFGVSLEENIGLSMMFGLRGKRHSPADVVIVSVDKESAKELNLPDDPRKWPRQLHARLVQKLKQEGARVIAFDIFFADRGSPKEDREFSDAIGKAGNVVLSGYLKREDLPLGRETGNDAGNLTVERLVAPAEPFARSAMGIAPFPLPKVPVRVSQYWTFKTGEGDIPTLPVVVLQAFTLENYGDFIQLMKRAAPLPGTNIPHDKNVLASAQGIEKLVRALKEVFQSDPSLATRMLTELDSEGTSFSSTEKDRMRSLINMYGAVNNRYLNFYGPPRTITTIPYYRFVSSGDGVAGELPVDVKGKAVFVGHSELYRLEQKDGFYTVFSQSNGLDLSGVEIAATAFANLLENMSVAPADFKTLLAIVVLWGMLAGFLCRRLSAAVAALSLLGLGIVYLLVAEYRFRTGGVWYPVVVPLFFQTSFGFFSAVSLKYMESSKDREVIRKAFGYYLPDPVVDRLSKNIAEIKTESELVYGICLSTDAEHYTSLSENMGPKELSSFLNRYYAAIFEPIRKHTGVVANVIGDSMLAIWVAATPDSALKHQACLAALDIAEEVRRFNESPDASPLPTRIGLHSGYIVLGHIGAVDHYEYRPVGDIVNTATRIEGLNKYLGTRILASEDVIRRVDGFLTRKLGKFLLVGKSKPIVVHELLSRTGDVNQKEEDTCTAFAAALAAFRRREWDAAMEYFDTCIKNSGGDGPSQFYLTLCEQYRAKPPGDSWDGEVYMDKK